MSNMNLMVHCGAQRVEEPALNAVPLPPRTATYTPIPHGDLFAEVVTAASRHGLSVAQAAHAITPDGARYFGMMELVNGSEDWTTVLGLRNSHDKAFGAGLVAGSGVFVCDNLCWSGEIQISRKHTAHMLRDLPLLVDEAVGKVTDAKVSQAARIEAYRDVELPDEAMIYPTLIGALDQGVISSARIGQVLREWREPSYPEFAEARSVWRLFNAFTTVMKPRPQGHDLWTLSARTIPLHNLLDQLADTQQAVGRAFGEAALHRLAEPAVA